jgi:hypothetical protein
MLFAASVILVFLAVAAPFALRLRAATARSDR